MAIPESGFIHNVNKVADNIAVISEAASLFDTATVAVLNEIAGLNITLIVEDLKKSNYLGNRKLDINLALNNSSSTSNVTYKQATLQLKDGTSLVIPFQVQLPNSTWVTQELTSHADIKNYIQNSSAYAVSVINTELTIEDPIGTAPQVIRFRDADGTSSNLDRIDLVAYSGSYISGISQYTWADTTSSLQTLANRATDILVLGQSIDNIIVLSNMNTELSSLHTNIAAITALYTDLTEVMTVYSNLTALLAIHTNIAAVTTTSINIAQIASVSNSIVPNLAEILQADSNAASASLSSTQASDNALASSIQAANAATSASIALGYLNQFSNLVANANTLTAGSNASASYNTSTGVLTLGIPQGIKGDKGDAFAVNAFGLFSTRSTYDAQSLGFSYLAVDTSTLYFKASTTSGDWTAGVLFGKGDTGSQGVQGYSWLTGAGVPLVGNGVNGDIYLNTSNSDVYTKSTGVWGSPITNLSAGINDSTTSSALTWSSTKVSSELATKSTTTHTHTGIYEPLNANIQNHIDSLVNPHAVTKTQVGLGNVDNTSNATERAATGTLTNKTISTALNTITTAASGNLTATELNAALAELQLDIDSRITTSNKDTSNGVVGMTLFKINFKDITNTFTSLFTNSNSAARTYTFQDRDGTIVDTIDLALKAPLASPTFTGTVTLPTDTVAITKAVNTNTTALATTAFVLGQASSILPQATGTAAAGTATKFSREDHVHASAGGSGATGTIISSQRLVATATASQTVFACPTYAIGSKQLRVYINGVRQFDSEYTETSTSSVTLTVGATVSDVVLCEVDGYISNVVTAASVTFSPSGTISATDAQTAIAALDMTKAPLASPDFSGTPKMGGVEIGYKNIPQNAQNASYSLAVTDNGNHIYSANAGAQTITIPTNAVAAIPIGAGITLVNNGTTAMTFSSAGVVVYKAGTSASWASGGTMAVRGMATLLKVAADVWFISGAGLS